MGIEPTSSAWKAEVLPLNYTRHNNNGATPALRLLSSVLSLFLTSLALMHEVVEGVGFEPT